MNKAEYDRMRRNRTSRFGDAIPTFGYQDRADRPSARFIGAPDWPELHRARRDRRKAALRLRLLRGRGRV